MSRQGTRKLRPSSRLILHDVRLAQREVRPGVTSVVATVDCERMNCTIELERCVCCERFSRVDVHEAGYIMWCRSKDEALDEDDR